MREFKPVNLERYEIVVGEWMVIVRGFVMVVSERVLIVNGDIQIDGMLKVG